MNDNHGADRNHGSTDNGDTDERLDAIDRAIVDAMAGGASVAEAAKTAGVGERTVYRRLNRPLVRAAITDTALGRVRPTVRLLHDEMPAAVRVLVTLRDDPTTHPSTRLRASVALIELGFKGLEVVAIGPRLVALEAALDASLDHQTDVEAKYDAG